VAIRGSEHPLPPCCLPTEVRLNRRPHPECTMLGNSSREDLLPSAQRMTHGVHLL
jgi:hypothetical protein